MQDQSRLAELVERAESWKYHADRKIGGGYLFSVYHPNGSRVLHNIPKQLAQQIVLTLNLAPALARCTLALGRTEQMMREWTECEKCTNQVYCEEHAQEGQKVANERNSALAALDAELAKQE